MITVFPYVEIEGKYTLPDETVKAVLYKMVQDGTFQIVFYEGVVKSEEDFLKLLKAPGNYPVFVYVDNKIQGLAWVNDLKDNHATGHFCVFRESFGKNARDMGIEVLKYWFSFKNGDKPLFDVILGVTPSEYKFAVHFIEQIGFKILGEVPHVCYNAFTNKRGAATFSYCERFT
jgi:hypothetical protein